MAEYPRDLVGYGEHPPHPHWPGDARVCLQFVINYEEGGENNILHGDAASEAFLSEIVGAQPWPGQRHMNMESIYEYGSRAGYWRLHRLFTSRNMPVTVYAVASALGRYPGIVESMQRAGWEIATHGLKWIDYRDHTAEAERADLDEAVRLQTELTGQRPLGLYQGRSSVNTLALGCEEGGFLYLADAYADDLPYWIEGARGPQLVVPYTLDTNDMRFATPQGFNAGDQFFAYLKDSFDTLYAEGAEAPKMLSIGLHCRLVGRPGRSRGPGPLPRLRRVARAGLGGTAHRYRPTLDQNPSAGDGLPTQSNGSVALRRGLRRHLRAHARRSRREAHASGLSSKDDTAEGLHECLVDVMRSLSVREKRDSLCAHPDLAGRLALSHGLTADSTGEQAAAGLDRLSPDELERFTALNARYRERFGIPFIMAVKGRTKQEIVTAFEHRLRNTPEQEFETALVEVERIALLRLKDRLPPRA